MSLKKNLLYSLLIYSFVLMLPQFLNLFLTKEILNTILISTVTVAYSAGVVFLVLLNRATCEIRKIEDRPKQTKKNTQIVLWGFLGIFFALITQGIVSSIEINLFGSEMTSQNTEDITSIVKQSPLFLFAVAIAGPFMEEFIFRRSIIGFLSNYMNIWLAAIFSSAIFSVAHVDGHYLLYFSMGYLFFLLYNKTGSIWTSIITHCGMNFIALMIQLASSTT